MIGAVLLTVSLGILLLGIVQFWQLTLDDAVRVAGRQVELGATTVGTGPQFAAAVCSEFGMAAPNCQSGLQYDVQSAASFGSMSPASLSANGQLTPAGSYLSFTHSYPVLVQVAYPVPINLPLLPIGWLTLNGTPSLVSALVFLENPS